LRKTVPAPDVLNPLPPSLIVPKVSVTPLAGLRVPPTPLNVVVALLMSSVFPGPVTERTVGEPELVIVTPPVNGVEVPRFTPELEVTEIGLLTVRFGTISMPAIHGVPVFTSWTAVNNELPVTFVHST
jgi:hypothetical protein